MPIDASRWAEVTALFAELAALPQAARHVRLDGITDTALRDEVQSLLAADDSVGSRFDRAPMLDGLVTGGGSVATPVGLEPERVGAWRIARRLGQGGMGTVYEAVREDAGFTKRAALKMIHGFGVTHPTLVQRFEVERRILARLSHRNIATLLDGGVHTDGRPWFAMEYVDGEPLVRWCTARSLDVRARVQLMRQACGAVQYAHEHLVVHRDIKPANMLVDADGTLKLLDFGIARPSDDSEAHLTETGLSPMTTAYASPEQRAGRSVTTATDIWSLGVVLYELLAGVRPDPASPAPPSQAVLTAPRDDAANDGAAARRTSQQLRGELDAIVMMCLRPEPDRRYTTAAELGKDLQRWLDGRTVMARPDTLSYRLTMLVRRNRLATGALAAALLALVTGTIVSVRQAAIARAERDRAVREQARTQRVSAFFQQVLTQSAPRNGGRAVTVAEALTRAIPVIDTAFTREPDLRAAVQLSLGSALQNLQQHEPARALLQAAADYYRTHDGAVASRDQTDALWDLATMASHDGKHAEAESLYVRLVTLYRQPGNAPNASVMAQLRIAGLRLDTGDLAGAVAAYDSLLPRMQLLSREDSLDFAANVGSRGTTLAALGRYDRAVTDLRRALALNERLLGPGTFASGEVLQPLAGAMLFTGHLAEADSIARRAVAIFRREFGDDASGTFAARRMLGTVLVAERQCDEAVRVFSEILTHRGRGLADADPTVGYSLVHRAWCRAVRGDVAGGAADARDGLRLTAAAVGEQHYAYHLAQSLAGATLGMGAPSQNAEALRLLTDGAAGLRRTLDPAHARVRDADARLTEFRERTATK